MASTHIGVRHCLSMTDLTSYHARGMAQVRHMSGIAPGDEIEALSGGMVYHSGRVAEVLPDMDLFWIFDDRSQLRKLIELDEFTVFVRENRPSDAPTLEEQP
jgi:hypothetical protein